MRLLALTAVACLAVMSMPGAASAATYDTCLDLYAETKGDGLGFAPSDVERIVGEIAAGISLPASGISAVPCDSVIKVEANVLSAADYGNRSGEYIFYEPSWVREVIGPNFASAGVDSPGRAEAIVLFGHELGHILGRHFSANVSMNRVDKETAADRFAGCAAGYMSVPWPLVENFLSKIRVDFENGTYPPLPRSLEVARDGYDRCVRREAPPPDFDIKKDLLAKLRVLQPGDAAGLKDIGELFIRESSSRSDPVWAFELAMAFVELASLDTMRDYSDGERHAIWRTLSLLDQDWWGLVEWQDARRQLLGYVASFDDFAGNDTVDRSAEMTKALDVLKRRLGYVVPPTRVVEVMPFRVQVEYCGTVTCDIDFIIRGYDERGNLRVDEYFHVAGVREREFRDIEPSQAVYFQVEPGSNGEPHVKWALFCRFGSEVVEGSTASINWTPSTEVRGGMAVWPSCAGTNWKASLGLAVSPDTSGRRKEQAVKSDPGRPWN